MNNIFQLPNLTSQESSFLCNYLLDYLDGEFSQNNSLDNKFIKLCRKAYPENKNINLKLYRALRVNYNTPITTLISSHKKLISTSKQSLSATLACYGFGIDLDKEFDKIVVYELINPDILLTFQQIMQIILEYPRYLNVITINRTIKEIEYLVLFNKDLLKTSSVIKEYTDMKYLSEIFSIQKLQDYSIEYTLNNLKLSNK